MVTWVWSLAKAQYMVEWLLTGNPTQVGRISCALCRPLLCLLNRSCKTSALLCHLRPATWNRTPTLSDTSAFILIILFEVDFSFLIELESTSSCDFHRLVLYCTNVDSKKVSIQGTCTHRSSFANIINDVSSLQPWQAHNWQKSITEQKLSPQWFNIFKCLSFHFILVYWSILAVKNLIIMDLHNKNDI